MINEIDVLRIFNDHDKIVKTYEVHELDDYIVLIQELVNGVDLNNFITKEHQENIEEYNALEILHSLLQGIMHIHKKGYIHRDIKPANVMMVKKKNEKLKFDKNVLWDVKIIDFGLCVPSWDFSENSFLKDKSGTVGYLAPELLKKSRDEFYDSKIDIFSSGVLFYEMYFY